LSEKLYISGVSEELKSKVDSMAKQSGLSMSQVVITALNYYFEHEGRDYDGLYKILNDVYNPLHDRLDLIEMILNKLDFNAIMYKEFLNHYFNINRDPLVTTKMNYTDQLMDLENHANDEIARLRTMKMGR